MQVLGDQSIVLIFAFRFFVVPESFDINYVDTISFGRLIFFGDLMFFVVD